MVRDGTARARRLDGPLDRPAGRGARRCRSAPPRRGRADPAGGVRPRVRVRPRMARAVGQRAAHRRPRPRPRADRLRRAGVLRRPRRLEGCARRPAGPARRGRRARRRVVQPEPGLGPARTVVRRAAPAHAARPRASRRHLDERPRRSVVARAAGPGPCRERLRGRGPRRARGGSRLGGAGRGAGRLAAGGPARGARRRAGGAGVPAGAPRRARRAALDRAFRSGALDLRLRREPGRLVPPLRARRGRHPDRAAVRREACGGRRAGPDHDRHRGHEGRADRRLHRPRRRRGRDVGAPVHLSRFPVRGAERPVGPPARGAGGRHAERDPGSHRPGARGIVQLRRSRAEPPSRCRAPHGRREPARGADRLSRARALRLDGRRARARAGAAVEPRRGGVPPQVHRRHDHGRAGSRAHPRVRARVPRPRGARETRRHPSHDRAGQAHDRHGDPRLGLRARVRSLERRVRDRKPRRTGAVLRRDAAVDRILSCRSARTTGCCARGWATGALPRSAGPASSGGAERERSRSRPRRCWCGAST